jgi:predicted RNA-binding protein associated with RNAse of E/G family
MATLQKTFWRRKRERERGRNGRTKKNGDVREYVTLGKRRKQMRQNCENDGSNSPGTGTKKKWIKFFRKFSVARKKAASLGLLT